MKNLNQAMAALALVSVTVLNSGIAQEWPQWRGLDRDAKANGFIAPKTWPADLTKKWSVTVGNADASPSLMGGKLYVFARQDGNEVIQCLDAATGKELWSDKYEAEPATGPASGHAGPRSSPAVADGKVVTLGVRGVVSCFDASTGKRLWQKDDFAGEWPKFFTSSSPIIVEKLCIAQLGGEQKGGVVAYDLATGDQKWKWTEDGTAYASPVLLNLPGTTTLVGLTAKNIVGLGVSDGKMLWEEPFAPSQRMAYNAATPLVNGQTVIYAGSGRGTKAIKVEKTGDGFAAKEVWSNPDNSVQFNSPVMRGDQIYGIAQSGTLFCLNAKDGKTLWTASLGGRGFGSIVDVGSVLLALTPQGDLVVFEPSEKEFKKVASYKVGSDTYGYPIPSGKGIYVKDKDAVTYWAVE